MALPLRQTLLLSAFAVACSTVIAFVYHPVPWTGEPVFEWPSSYVVATGIADIVAIVFIGAFAWQIAEESRLLADALAATELVLAREQHLSQLDGLAAAAAHELGTPLATIAVIAKELERALGPASPHSEDVELLRSQAQRCREILGRLSALAAWRRAVRHAEALRADRGGDRAASRFRHRDRGCAAGRPHREPVTARKPGDPLGLGNLVENAVDFAASRVKVAVRWSEQDVAMTIADDGPGYSSRRSSTRIGEPYVTSRRRVSGEGDEASGLGPGLLHRQDAAGALRRQRRFPEPSGPGEGAVVRVRWPAFGFDRPVELEPATAVPLELRGRPGLSYWRPWLMAAEVGQNRKEHSV